MWVLVLLMVLSVSLLFWAAWWLGREMDEQADELRR
jgi:hypothetical protein